MFEGLKAQLDRMLAQYGGDERARAAGLYDAVVEARAAVSGMRSALLATERELAAERQLLADTERRGRLAAQVPDPETVAVAERFAARHRERVAVLERKVAVQRDELHIAEREVDEMMAQLRAARPGGPGIPGGRTGGDRPVEDPDARLDMETERLTREAAVEAQLAELKRKVKRDQQ